MNRKKALLVSLMLLFSGCSLFHKSAPSRDSSNQAATVVATTRDAVQDRIAGNNAAISYTAGKLPESREKEVISLFVGDQFRLVGQPSQTTQTQFEKAAAELLSADAKDRANGDSLRQKLAGENQDLQAKLKKADADFAAARIKEEADHKAELDKVKEQAAREQKKLISYIFFGGGALLLGLGVVVLLTMASVPMFGPKVAFGLMAAGGVSIGTGILILELMAELEKHPSIIWIGFVTILGLLTGAGALTYANHKHHTGNV